MSSTDIYGFRQDGTAYLYASVRNSWRGAMAVWNKLEVKYLPPYIPGYIKACNWYKPDMKYEEIVTRNGFRPTRLNSEISAREICDLADSPEVSEVDKTVLMTTFDNVVVRKADLPKIIEAFNQFVGETNLKEQAEVLQVMYEDDDCIAVAWNQTSVNADMWVCYSCNEATEESTPYNIFKHDKHWFMFNDNTDKPGGNNE